MGRPTGDVIHASVRQELTKPSEWGAWVMSRTVPFVQYDHIGHDGHLWVEWRQFLFHPAPSPSWYIFIVGLMVAPACVVKSSLEFRQDVVTARDGITWHYTQLQLPVHATCLFRILDWIFLRAVLVIFVIWWTIGFKVSCAWLSAAEIVCNSRPIYSTNRHTDIQTDKNS